MNSFQTFFFERQQLSVFEAIGGLAARDFVTILSLRHLCILFRVYGETKLLGIKYTLSWMEML